MAKAHNIALAMMVLLSCSTVSVNAKNEAMQKGIEAYNARAYSEAVTHLESATRANPKSELAHYYLGLTYQALNRNADAEREYNLNYRNGKDADLKYKSWQGLVSLSRLRKGRPATATAAKAESRVQPVSSIAVKAGGSPYKAEQGKAPTSESGFTAGCFKH